jgi:protein arginine phosphatase
VRNILFVCTGNTCRSPMAEYLLKEKEPGRYTVQSAGLAAFPGSDASPEVIRLLSERGLDVSHESQTVTPELMDWADIVLTMTEAHRQALLVQYPQYGGQIHTLKTYVQERLFADGKEDEKHQPHTAADISIDGVSPGPNISDPIGGSMEVYRETLNELDILLTFFTAKSENGTPYHEDDQQEDDETE